MHLHYTPYVNYTSKYHTIRWKPHPSTELTLAEIKPACEKLTWPFTNVQEMTHFIVYTVYIEI